MNNIEKIYSLLRGSDAALSLSFLSKNTGLTDKCVRDILNKKLKSDLQLTKSIESKKLFYCLKKPENNKDDRPDICNNQNDQNKLRHKEVGLSAINYLKDTLDKCINSDDVDSKSGEKFKIPNKCQHVFLVIHAVYNGFITLDEIFKYPPFEDLSDNSIREAVNEALKWNYIGNGGNPRIGKPNYAVYKAGYRVTGLTPKTKVVLGTDALGDDPISLVIQAEIPFHDEPNSENEPAPNTNNEQAIDIDKMTKKSDKKRPANMTLSNKKQDEFTGQDDASTQAQDDAPASMSNQLDVALVTATTSKTSDSERQPVADELAHYVQTQTEYEKVNAIIKSVRTALRDQLLVHQVLIGSANDIRDLYSTGYPVRKIAKLISNHIQIEVNETVLMEFLETK